MRWQTAGRVTTVHASLFNMLKQATNQNIDAIADDVHIDLDRGCSATPDPPEPRTPPIDGGAISKSAFNSGRAAGMRVSPSCMNSLW
mgnify:CR=1 FL=1